MVRYETTSLTAVLAEVAVHTDGTSFGAIEYIEEQVRLAVQDFSQTMDKLETITDNHYLSKSNMFAHVLNTPSGEISPEIANDVIKHIITCSGRIGETGITMVTLAERIAWLMMAVDQYTQSNSQEDN
jgi:hypothetical protein